jgi:hypothetical protein
MIITFNKTIDTINHQIPQSYVTMYYQIHNFIDKKNYLSNLLKLNYAQLRQNILQQLLADRTAILNDIKNALKNNLIDDNTHDKLIEYLFSASADLSREFPAI